MRVSYDEKANAMYIRFDESKIVEAEEVRPGIIIDFNEHDQVAGIEILRVSERIALESLKKMQFEFV